MSVATDIISTHTIGRFIIVTIGLSAIDITIGIGHTTGMPVTDSGITTADMGTDSITTGDIGASTGIIGISRARLDLKSPL